MEVKTPKKEMSQILESLLDDVSWEEILEEIHLKKSIYEGYQEFEHKNIV